MTDKTVPSESPVDETLPVEPVDTAPEPETEPEQQQEPDDAGTDEGKPKGGFQRRIKELADERNHWRDMALRASQGYQPPQQPQPPSRPDPAPAQPAKLPTLEEFGYDEGKYQAALLDYAAKHAETVVERRLAEVERQRAEQTRVESFATRQAEFAKSTPDFEDKVLRDPTLPITTGMRDVIIDSPNGPELAYWLATNRAEAEKIARLPPHLAALEMGRIEGRIEVQKAAKAAAPRPSVTKAPPPPPSLEATESAGPKPPEQMSDEEWYRAERRKQNLKQFRRKA